jgi:predicted MFS family arabinose efflux permease
VREHAASPARDSGGVIALAAAILLVCAGASMFQVEPLYLGAIAVAMGLDGSQIGLLAGVELGGAAMASVAAFFWITRLDWRFVAAGALLVMVAGNLVSVSVDNINTLMAVRFLTGMLGSGTVYAVGLAVIGDMPDPDRAFGFAIATLVTLTMAALLLLPVSISAWGPVGVLVPLALFALVVIPAATRIPSGTSRTPQEAASADATPVAPVLLALGVQVLWYTGVGGVWAFIERIGTSSGIGLAPIGSALAIGMGLGAAGALLASAVSDRWGRLPMFSVAMFAQVIALYVLTTHLAWSAFLLAAILFNVSWNFALPFLMGAIAARDPSGRFTVLIVAAQGLGVAVGPVIAGFLISGTGLAAVSYFGIVACVLSALLFIVACRSRSRVVPVEQAAD